jgi:hypothetical protein
LTASNSWWKAVAEAWLAVVPLALLCACGGSPQADSGITPLPQARAVPPRSSGSSRPPAVAGLTPLPTADQVVAAVPLGRVDPFLPTPVAVSRRAEAPVQLPAGFRFSGVIISGGQVQALVQLGSRSGSLRAGDRGGRSTDLLPPGWSVAGIDGQQGRLTLLQGGRRLVLEL